MKTALKLVELGLRLPLPTFRSGGHLVDISNREALYDVLVTRDADFHRFKFLEVIDPAAGKPAID